MPQFSELLQILSNSLFLHKSRLVCLVRLITRLMLVGTVNLTKVSLAFGSDAKNDSRYRRLRRFFAEVKINFDQIARIVIVLLKQNTDEPWILIFDRTRWDLGECANNILVLSLSLGDIAVPLFWKHIEKRGNSHAHDRIELLERFSQVFPADNIFPPKRGLLHEKI
jgi:hypothetical protein